MNKALEHDDVTIIDGDAYGYEESDQSKAFEDFRAAFKDEQMGTLRVHRVPVTNKTTNAAKLRTVYLFSCPIDAFGFEDLLEHIRDQYGGGTYRLIGSREGHRGHAFNRIVEIEAPKPKFSAPGVDGQGGAHGSNAAELVNNLGAVLLEHSSRVEEMMRGSAQPMGDPLDQMTKLMAAMGTAISTMGFKQTEPKSIVDQLAEFAAIKELFDGGGGGGGDANLYSLLTATVQNFGPLLGAAITSQTAAGAIPAAGPIRPALEAPAAPAPNPTPLPPELEAMRGQINFLVGQAKLGAKPADVAAAIMPGISGDALESIEAFLQKPNCIDVCAQVNAEVNTYRNWLQDWREAMLAHLGEVLEDPADAIPGNIDIDAPANDGEIIGPEALTPDAPGVQTSEHVAGLATDTPIRASTDSTGNDGDTNGTTGGPRRDEGDA